MAAVRECAEDEKEVESAEDRTQDLSGGHTHSPITSTTTTSTDDDNNNNSVGPQQRQSLDTQQSLLNGAQPSPFVCGAVQTAPCPDDSLPSGALVNGPASHCTSEEPHVPNKDTSPCPGTDTNPEVSEPPSELQSDTWRKPEGHVLKAPSTRTSSESESDDRKAPLDVAAGDGSRNGPISRPWRRKSVKTGFLWDVDSESSESSSDDYEDLNRGLQEKFMRLLLKGKVMREVKRRMENEGSSLASPSRRKRKLCRVERMPTEEDGDLEASLTDGDIDLDLSISKEHAWRKEPQSLRANVDVRLGNSRKEADGFFQFVSSEKQSRSHEGDDGDADGCVGGKPARLKSRQETEPEPSFYQCTKCNINFKEKTHLHRHMMYHLSRHNQVGQESGLRPFICKECGRSFRERSTLHKHMQIHQVRRERLMQEIKGLNRPQDEGLDARLGCPHCAFTTDCPKTFVRHAKTHNYSCDECDYEASTELDLEEHRQTHQDRFLKIFDTYLCKSCTFSTKNMNAFRKHLELIHKQPFYDYDLQRADSHMRPVLDQEELTGQTKTGVSPPLSLKPKSLRDKQNGWKAAGLSMRSNGTADLYVRDKGTQESGKGLSSSLIKWSFGSLANNLSPSSLRCDKPSKLSVPTERMDVTTGLPYVEEDNQGYESAVSQQKTKYRSSFDTHLTTTSSKTAHLNPDTANAPKDPSERGVLATQAQKSPSKRKMSIPSRNTPSNHLIFPKSEPVSPEWQEDTDALQGSEYEYDDDNDDDANYYDNTPANLLDGNEGGHSPYDANHFIRQGFSLKEDSCNSADHSDHEDYLEGDEICTFIVKEESIESPVSEGNVELEYTDHNLSDSYTSYQVSPVLEMDRKSCPYCPAVFESGVGLSNHVRGHLHRLGLSYDARHMLSPEQVASQDRQPRIRRRAPSIIRRTRKDKPLSQTEHTCPLCLGWFDTKTGLSNHVRGHLKRIGKPITGVSKSPLSILTELLQDENEHQKILRSLEGKPHFSRPFISQKFVDSEGLFLTPTGVPVKVQRQWSSEEAERRKKSEEINAINETSSSTLIELLKKKRLDPELEEASGHSQAARTRILPSSRNTAPAYLPPLDLSSSGSIEKLEINKKICIHCNATFHSAVSLSNHLRAYARRKRIALLEGTSYECSQKRPRLRPGPKRKEFPSSHTASEVIYRLTCRFCDLVFQGPQSVQEDWVKHLQRHLMHTSVPGTGASMVEVTAMCEELCDTSLEVLPFPQLAQGLS
ncbi:zinc finger protein 644 [Hoplias malabaricus]|uniref:zinc finger protein 644 n=1 Tax=Hoplias malabaricus TaxID=27720 RepID=UPI00346251AD